MKVLVDFREAAKDNRAGKGEYVHQLVSALIEVAPEWEFVLLTFMGQKIDLPSGNWSQKSFRGGRLFWHIIVSWWCELFNPADVFFATTSAIVPVFISRIPVVMTIFDFTVWRYPATHLGHAVRLEKMFLPAALKRAKHLISISDFTKQEAIDLFNINSNKITTTRLGVNSNFKPLNLTAQNLSRLKNTYNLPDKFILYLGTLEPRKNLPMLISAFKSIQSQHPQIKLVLAGNLGWQNKNTKEMLNENIITIGYVKDEDRPALYNMAEVFVFPSLYEGFGMPPLEAMACGTPTIVSNAASLPEVVQDGAIQIELKTEALSSALEKILNSSELRQELSQKGIARAKELTWESTAKVTMEVLNRYG